MPRLCSLYAKLMLMVFPSWHINICLTANLLNLSELIYFPIVPSFNIFLAAHYFMRSGRTLALSFSRLQPIGTIPNTDNSTPYTNTSSTSNTTSTSPTTVKFLHQNPSFNSFSGEDLAYCALKLNLLTGV